MSHLNIASVVKTQICASPTNKPTKTFLTKASAQRSVLLTRSPKICHWKATFTWIRYKYGTITRTSSDRVGLTYFTSKDEIFSTSIIIAVWLVVEKLLSDRSVVPAFFWQNVFSGCYRFDKFMTYGRMVMKKIQTESRDRLEAFYHLGLGLRWLQIPHYCTFPSTRPCRFTRVFTANLCATPTSIVENEYRLEHVD